MPPKRRVSMPGRRCLSKSRRRRERLEREADARRGIRQSTIQELQDVPPDSVASATVVSDSVAPAAVAPLVPVPDIFPPNMSVAATPPPHEQSTEPASPPMTPPQQTMNTLPSTNVTRTAPISVAEESPATPEPIELGNIFDPVTVAVPRDIDPEPAMERLFLPLSALDVNSTSIPASGETENVRNDPVVSASTRGADGEASVDSNDFSADDPDANDGNFSDDAPLDTTEAGIIDLSNSPDLEPRQTRSPDGDFRPEDASVNSDDHELSLSHSDSTGPPGRVECIPDPGTSDPGTSDLGTADPGTSDLGTADPGTADRAPVAPRMARFASDDSDFD